MTEKRHIRRRWFQFSLRTFLIVTMLVGFGGAWFGMQLQQKRRHQAVANEIFRLGGGIYVSNKKSIPAWKEWLFGSYAVETVAIDLQKKVAIDALLSQTQGMKFNSLLLISTQLTDVGLSHLKGFTNLEKLSLNKTQITNAGLTHLQGMAGLKVLYLGKTQITDEGLEHLKGLTSLEVIDLCDTPITDAGLTHLKGMSGLRILFLRNTQITDAGLEQLKGFTGLTTVDLENTQVSDAGLLHLKGLTNLTEVTLQNTQVTAAGVGRLHKAIPDCRIPYRKIIRPTCVRL